MKRTRAQVRPYSDEPARTAARKLRFRLRRPQLLSGAKGGAVNDAVVSHRVYGADPRTLAWVYALDQRYGAGQAGPQPGRSPGLPYGNGIRGSGNGINGGGRYAGDLGPQQSFRGAAPFLPGTLNAPSRMSGARMGMQGGPSSQAGFPSSNRGTVSGGPMVDLLLRSAAATVKPGARA